MSPFRILLAGVAVLGVALLSSFIAEAQPAQGDAHRMTIERAYNEWVEAANAKNLDRWASFMAPDPLFLPPNHPPLRGERAVREYYARSFADSRFSLNCHQQRVEVAEAEDMAWSTGICEATFTGPKGEPARASSKWAKVWVRMPDGSWKCTLNSWSLNGASEDNG
jgi:uncharacterized protein (TIGR02246 family)